MFPRCIQFGTSQVELDNDGADWSCRFIKVSSNLLGWVVPLREGKIRFRAGDVLLPRTLLKTSKNAGSDPLVT